VHVLDRVDDAIEDRLGHQQNRVWNSSMCPSSPAFAWAKRAPAARAYRRGSTGAVHPPGDGLSSQRHLHVEQRLRREQMGRDQRRDVRVCSWPSCSGPATRMPLIVLQ
jgi:hypothetical protein